MPAEGRCEATFSGQLPKTGEMMKQKMDPNNTSKSGMTNIGLRPKRVDVIKLLSETAGAVALAGALSLVKVFTFPQGGSVTLASMVPIFLLALRRGWKIGILGGLMLGLVVLIEEPFVVHPVQLLLDYPIAFGTLGLAGFFRRQPLVGVGIGMVARFAAHFVSGVVFFASYAGDLDPYTYSAIYNALYLIPEFVVSAVAIWLLVRAKALEIYL